MHFLHALENAVELKSSDRFCQLARKTFACTCAARDYRHRAKWAPFSNAKWLFWLLSNIFKHWKNITLSIFFCKTGVLTGLGCNLATVIWLPTIKRLNYCKGTRWSEEICVCGWKCAGGHAELKHGEAVCLPNDGVVLNASFWRYYHGEVKADELNTSTKKVGPEGVSMNPYDISVTMGINL